MAKYSVSAFNEKNATRMLADFLEQKHTVATFFKENDRTPNYDGTFELVGKDEAPTKQFVFCKHFLALPQTSVFYYLQG